MAPRSEWATFTLFLVCFIAFIVPNLSVKHGDFKTCDQSGFCKRNRAYAKEAAEKGRDWFSPYALDESTLKFNDGFLTSTVLKTINDTSRETVRFPLTVAFLESGVARLTLDEEKRQKGDIQLRHDSKVRKERSDEVQKWVIAGGLQKSSSAAISKDAPAGTTRVLYGPAGKHEALIQHKPFRAEFKRDGETQIVFNDGGLMNMEHWRPKIERPPPEKKEGEENKEAEQPQGPDESTWWDESFHGNTDSKPRGPESVAMDITFPGYEHVYGIPEHSGPLSLKETTGGDGKHSEPYRLYNTDVAEYELDSPMTLYGSIPFMQAHKRSSTCGVFWLNAAETWVDIRKESSKNPLSKQAASTKSHWFFESGLMDIFVFLGPTPQEMSQQYAELTGYTQLPQEFAIAHHQCRWNYVSDEDVRDVDRKMNRYDAPYDVIWLDIEYLDDKKYFTWDPLTFGDSIGMQQQLDDHGRKLVAIIDPHIKRTDNYFVMDELKSKDLAVKNKEISGPFEGQCWPGASYWVDTFNPATHAWWKTLHKYDRWVGSAKNTFLWNDMNEPSVFGGPDMTMPKDMVHHGGWEHRDVHNVNGLTYINASFGALQVRDDPKGKTPTTRPFILTRSFYAGSQRLGAMWTGDNQARWDHLAASIPMVLQNGISGFPFAGADVGGFFWNPSHELLVRWYQAGAFYPFFRAHAHIDTRRREPYMIPEPERSHMIEALRLRYALLPAWYTAFHTASTKGHPIVRPMWWSHPYDSAGFGLDDQMYLGDTGLLVRPIVDEGATSANIYLPAAEEGQKPALYYDYFDYSVHSSSANGKSVKVDADLTKIPLLMKAGHIFPRRDRPRRSSALMKNDPFTLVIVLDPEIGSAEGSLYLDDGESYKYESGARVHRRFIFENNGLRSEDLDIEDSSKSFKKAKEEYLNSIEHLTVERVILVGVPKSWKEKTSVTVSEEEAAGARGKDEKQKVVSAEGTRRVGFTFVEGGNGKADWGVVRNPDVAIGRGWRINF
ncbi:MAG: hypothetical protein Q9159_000228 [Coniocarpon cinnabarinum]